MDPAAPSDSRKPSRQVTRQKLLGSHSRVPCTLNVNHQLLLRFCHRHPEVVSRSSTQSECYCRRTQGRDVRMHPVTSILEEFSEQLRMSSQRPTCDGQSNNEPLGTDVSQKPTESLHQFQCFCVSSRYLTLCGHCCGCCTSPFSHSLSLCGRVLSLCSCFVYFLYLSLSDSLSALLLSN